MRDQDYARAAEAYRTVLVHSPPDVRPLILHRLARTLKKAGQDDAATALFKSLAHDNRTYIGDVPLGLVAAYELRSPALYADLIAGRWLLDRTRLAFYADAAAAWTAPDRRRDLDLQRQAKRTLTEAAESLLSGSPQQTHVRVGPAPTPTGTVTALVSRSWMQDQVWRDASAEAVTQGLDVTLTMPGGSIAFASSGSRGAASGPLMASAALGGEAAAWQVTVVPTRPAAFTARFERQRLLYFVLLLLVVGLLGFGSYATARVVRRELEVAQIQSDFVATVSHELRSPLTAIRQLAELLVRGRVGDAARRQEYYEQIAREGDRLSRLVDTLLDFARMENGAKDYHFEALEPASWLRRVTAEAGHHYASRGVSIAADIPERLPEIIADPAALACAVENLLDNAVKYSPGRDTVWVSAASGAHGVTIAVRDAGVGIAATDQAHVFEKFYRGRASITQRVKGAGLGLSLVHRIVEAHGGSVACQSQPGVGTTFAIHLRAA